MKRRLLLGVAVSGLLVLTAACGSGGNGSNGSASGNTDSPSENSGSGGDGAPVAEGCPADNAGGTLRVSLSASPRTLDPFDGSGNTMEQGGIEFQAIYDKLVNFDVNAGEFVPNMAESLEPNDDSSVWTLTMREDITFGNGDPVDAAAVKASMDRHLDPEGGSALLGNAEQIESVELVDDLTLEITLTEPWGGFPSLLAGAFGTVQNVAVVEERGQEAFAADPTGGGAGPFEVVDYSAGESLRLEAKEDYWGGEVCLDEIRISTITDNQTAYDALKNGEVDLMGFGRDPELLNEIQENIDGFNSYMAGQIGGSILLINSGVDGTETPGSDVRVRQAIAMAIDPEVVNQRAYSGTATMSTGLIPEEAVVYEPTTGPTYDPDAARALLDEVKEETGWDGSIRLASNNDATISEAAIATKALLDAVGFDVDLTSQYTATEVSTLVRVDKDFDLAFWGLSAHEENLWTTLKQYYAGAPNNAGNFADDAMDDALDQLREAATDDETNAAIAAVQAVWTDQVPALPLTVFEPSVIWRDGVGGLEFTTNVVALLDQVYIDG